MNFQLKYKGEDINECLDLARTALQEHQPLDHLAAKAELENKVDKVSGKQLSTEDFTTILKSKLEALKNYDDANYGCTTMLATFTTTTNLRVNSAASANSAEWAYLERGGIAALRIK